MAKCLQSKHEHLNARSQVKNVAMVHNLTSGEMETGGYLQFAGQAA